MGFDGGDGKNKRNLCFVESDSEDDMMCMARGLNIQ